MDQRLSIFLNDGIPTCILSIVVVFAMLGLLIGAIVGIGKIIGCFANKSQNKKAMETEVVSVQTEIAASKEPQSMDDLELVAVITAVIAASMGTTSDQLQVRSLRKVQRKSL